MEKKTPDGKVAYVSDEMSATAKAEIDAQHDVAPGDNHHHTDANPAVISGTEARGGNPNGAGFNIYAISTVLVVIVMVIAFLVFAR